jgi:nucleotide-binding universal stress UspA family protein
MHFLVSVDVKSNHNSPLEWLCKKLYKSDDVITLLAVIQDDELITGQEDMARSELTSQIHHLETIYGKLHYTIQIFRNSLPGPVIVEQSNQLDIDMIIMGSRKRNTITAVIMGSVSLYVIQHATVPVTILKE